MAVPMVSVRAEATRWPDCSRACSKLISGQVLLEELVRNSSWASFSPSITDLSCWKKSVKESWAAALRSSNSCFLAEEDFDPAFLRDVAADHLAGFALQGVGERKLQFEDVSVSLDADPLQGIELIRNFQLGTGQVQGLLR